jgi:hypothetical protein
MSASGDSGNLNKVVKDLLAGWVDKSADGNEVSATNHVITAGSLKTLKRGVLFRVLFLLVHGHKGTIGYGNNYTSQKEVQKLAGEFNVNYALIDAEVRLDLCAKKYKQVHEIYLDAVRGKKEATIPGLFSEKWKAQD